jgi:NitT/TauT family transport system ATP-binding protein
MTETAYAAASSRPEVPRGAASPTPYVDLENVSLTYGEGIGQITAVQDLHLQVKRGEFVAVVGPSGCGKSTLMKLVTGLLAPTSGSVSVAGRKVERPIKDVGMAFQNATLMPWRTTLRNVMLPLEVVEPHKSRLRRARADYESRAARLLHSVGLQGFGDKHPWELSGGMQQRANLCRALIHEPHLLMMDEPFAALDAFTREELWLVMQDLWLQRQFTAILVTHDLREAVYLADTVHVMSQRPGRFILRRPIDLPRPRTLATTFEPYFVAIVKELHEKIGGTRTS